MNGAFSYEPEPLDLGGVELSDVSDVAVDSSGVIHAMVRGEFPLVVLDPRGRLLRRGGTGLFGNPHGIHIDAVDRVYAVDGARHIVVRLNPAGEAELTLGSPDEPSDSGTDRGDFKRVDRGAGPFNCPTKVTTSAAGDIFVSDGYGNARVHRFAADGSLLASWGEPGRGPGQFMLPHGIAADRDGLVYVADRENERIQVFEADGTLVSVWEGISRPTAICIRDDLVYVAELGRRMYVDNVLFRPDGTGPWSRIRVFDLGGNERASIGGPDPTEPGSFYAAHGLAVDPEGSVFVSEVRWPENETPRPGSMRPSLTKLRRRR